MVGGETTTTGGLTGEGSEAGLGAIRAAGGWDVGAPRVSDVDLLRVKAARDRVVGGGRFEGDGATGLVAVGTKGACASYGAEDKACRHELLPIVEEDIRDDGDELDGPSEEEDQVVEFTVAVVGLLGEDGPVEDGAEEGDGEEPGHFLATGVAIVRVTVACLPSMRAGEPSDWMPGPHGA